MTTKPYPDAMTTIAHRTVIGEDGEPEAAIIPWKVFVELRELLEAKEPNEVTRLAMEEPNDDLPRFNSTAELMAELNS